MHELDRIDRKILDILQRQGRMSMTELGSEIGLSTSPCAERVRRLERSGIITGYHAHVSPQALGRTVLVFVELTLSTKSGEIFDKVYSEASLNAVKHDVQTTLVAPGGATIAELKVQHHGSYLLVDHALSRTGKGAVGVLEVTGEPTSGVYKAGKL